MARVAPDRCPGALTIHQAADGGLARVRLPGGAVSADQLRVLARAAHELGNGSLELTSRGNVQIRGLGSAADLGERLADAGLLPSLTHERVRNIVASPLGSDALYDVVHELDRALCARPRLAELSGRFLFAVDGGAGDVASLEPDVLVEDVPSALAAAEAFLDERDVRGSLAWRIVDLTGEHPVKAAPVAAPAGRVTLGDGTPAVVALVPLGRLAATTADTIASQCGPRGARITPWRSVVVLDTDSVAPFATAGLGVGTESRWYGVSACTGRPGCSKALADVQTDAAADAERWHGRTVHWSGCERRCGRPVFTEIDVVATTTGYVISE